MGGCHSSGMTRMSKRRKRELTDESEPYLPTDAKQPQQFWIDPTELEDKNQGLFETIKDKKKSKRSSRLLEMDLKSLITNIDPWKAKEEQKYKDAVIKARNGVQNGEERLADLTIPTEKENDAQKDFAMSLNETKCMGERLAASQNESNVLHKASMEKEFAVLYAGENQVQIVTWKEYQSEYLPSFIEERERVNRLKETEKYEYSNESSAETKSKEKNLMASEVCSEGRNSGRPLSNNPYTLIYDTENQYVQLISLEDYIAHHLELDKKNWSNSKSSTTNIIQIQNPKTEDVDEYDRKTDHAVIYDAETQTAKLISWVSYVNEYLPSDVDVRKLAVLKRIHANGTQRKTISLVSSLKSKIANEIRKQDYTVVYDNLSKESKLILWTDYLNSHKLPRQDWAVIYDKDYQTSKLIFWKDRFNFMSESDPIFHFKTSKDFSYDLNKSKKADNKKVRFTTVYDLENQEVKIISWDTYVANFNRPRQDWALTYNAERQSTQLIFWKDFLKTVDQYRESTNTTMCNNDIKEIPFPSSDEKVLKQDCACGCHNKKNQENKIFEEYQDKFSSFSNNKKIEFTTIYDEVLQEVKLVPWTEYAKENTLPKQDWSVTYDALTKSVKLIFWKGSRLNKNKPNISASHQRQQFTTVYNYNTNKIDYLEWTKYEEKHMSDDRKLWNQSFAKNLGRINHGKNEKFDLAAVYDDNNFSVKLIDWCVYESIYLPIFEEERQKKSETLLINPIINNWSFPEATPCIDEKKLTIDMFNLETY